MFHCQMTLLLMGCCFLCALAVNPDGSFTAAAMKVQFRASPAVDLTYELDMAKKYADFELMCTTIGYCALGISPVGAMANADIFLGGIGAANVPYYMDASSKQKGRPDNDTIQNWDMKKITEVLQPDGNSVKTTMRFGRKFDTGDPAQDIIMDDRDTYFIWAVGQSDALLFHGQNHMGSSPVNFKIGGKPEPGPGSTGDGNVLVSSLTLVLGVIFALHILANVQGS